MTLELALATKYISRMLQENSKTSKKQCIDYASLVVRSQGFSEKHADQVAKEAYELVK
jgi:hypothetical protein